MASLYNKYRPDNWEGVRGNEDTVEGLKTALAKKDRAHVYLLYGPPGCGKTTIGRIFANELGCRGNDFREVNFANMRGIDTVREIINQTSYKPLEGPVRVWLIDEPHKMTNDAQNAFLKIAEDTPAHCYFIFCTTEPNKLIAPLMSRFVKFPVEVLTEKQLSRELKRIAKAEGQTVQQEVIDQIVQDSLGHPRAAINILEKIIDLAPERRLKAAQQAAAEQSQVIELCRALTKAGTGWKTVANILEGLKTQDPEGIRRQVLGYAQAILLKGDNSQAGAVLEEFIDPTYNSGFPQIVYASYCVIKNQ